MDSRRERRDDVRSGSLPPPEYTQDHGMIDEREDKRTYRQESQNRIIQHAMLPKAF